jgi:endonuclease-8
MEGPSIHLAVEQLQPFVGQRVLEVDGNSRIGIDRLRRQRVVSIFAWGKHLVLQFGTFALRVHFMLWGTFAATVRGVSVTGDYRRAGAPRLMLRFARGEITIWSASLKYLEGDDVRSAYDFTADVLSDAFDATRAIRRAKAHPDEQIADVLLDQTIFAGVGNIIKNEILFRTRTSPFTRVRNLAPRQLRAIVVDARAFSFRFLELRRAFQLRKHLEVYGRGVCPSCQGRIRRRVHGSRRRRSFYCPRCQRNTPEPSSQPSERPGRLIRTTMKD